jgi:hypothetical protein
LGLFAASLEGGATARLRDVGETGRAYDIVVCIHFFFFFRHHRRTASHNLQHTHTQDKQSTIITIIITIT